MEVFSCSCAVGEPGDAGEGRTGSVLFLWWGRQFGKAGSGVPFYSCEGTDGVENGVTFFIVFYPVWGQVGRVYFFNKGGRVLE